MRSNDSIMPITYQRRDLTDIELHALHRQLVYPRLIEEKMLNLLRQGRISKWFSGIGQEAISVGVTSALQKEEWIFPLHRNLGVFTTREMPLDRLFAQWQGKINGYTKGRDRSFHFGNTDFHICGMISHLGPQLALADGAALASVLKEENKVAVAFTGEGGTSEGDFHEALNVAAVWNLPVLFVIENNGYGLSTPTDQQYACQQLADRGIGYGIEAHTIDGNNILEVYHTVKQLGERMRKNPKPILLECMTFRMRGHEEASGVKYVPKELLETWAKKDPLLNYEAWMINENLIDSHRIELIHQEIKDFIQAEVEKVFDWPDGDAEIDNEMQDVYAAFNYIQSNATTTYTEMRFIDAIKSALDEAMQRHPQLVLMGQDIAEYGGVFKITEGFVEKYGKARVRNTPICESAILGAALGLSLENIPSMVEMQFADFVSCGFNQIVNNFAKIHYRWGQHANVVVRMPTGAGTQAGPFHSQSNEAWFTHVPGLKIVYPSTPEDAKGLLLTAFEDPNPVLFFEHKALYRGIEGKVPDGYYTLEFGKARIVKKGEACTIITYGYGVKWSEEICADKKIDADIIDLRTLVPLDYNTISESIKKTNRVIIVHEDTLFGGLGAEISAYINEHLFEYLDAPVLRCASLDTPIPFSKRLEDQFLAKNNLAEKLNFLLNY